MKIKPLSNRVLVKLNPGDQISAGGIHLPGTTEDRLTKGEVIAVGPGKVTDIGDTTPMSVSVGDQVLIDRLSGVPISEGQDKYNILKEDEILGVL